MIDFHNHILPAVDDGSKNLEMSIRMLRHAYEQGITDVVNTVHYQHPKVEQEDISIDRISSEVDSLRAELEKEGIPIKIHIGAEVFFLPNLMQIKDDPLTTFLNSKFMLIEFQVHQLPVSHKTELYNLKLSGITPIIAHPERYKFVQDNISIVYDWLNAGCLIQVDAGSVLGSLGKQSAICAERIIKNGWCQILGSDSHDDKKRNFCLKESLDIVKYWIGNNAYELVNDNPRSVLNGKNIKIDIEPEPQKVYNLWTNISRKLRL